MQIRALLRKRLHIHVGWSEPALPTVQAAGDDTAPSVGSWFSANFGVGNFLTALGLCATLITGYANLRSQATENGRRIDTLNTRVVNRTEIETALKDTNARIDTLQAGQMLIFHHLLEEKH